jgi:uncharacterized protein YggE
VEFSGIDAGLSKEKELQDEVWEKALSNAREKAEKTLKGASMKIDSIFAISPVAFPQISQSIFRGGGEVAGYSINQGARKADPSQYRLAPVTVSQSVHVIYWISPAK